MRLALIAASLLFALASLAQDDDAFLAWAQARRAPLAADGTFRSLDTRLAEARLIGVGESVHDSNPFLGFRLQLLQDLVRRHNVTALVMESGMPEAAALNEWVHGRRQTIDFDAVMPGGFGALVEIRRTMEWLREWNRGAGRAHPVSVYGADFGERSGSLLPALDALREVASADVVTVALIDSIRPVAAEIAAGWWMGAQRKYDPLSAEVRGAMAVDVSLLAQRVEALRVRQGERMEWAHRLSRMILHHETMLRTGAFSATAPRDEALAEQTLWVVNRLPAGERAVYWAHNAHVQRTAVHGPALPAGRFPGSGRRFDVALGRAYMAIATAYGGPARDDASAALAGSVDGTLEKVDAHPFVISFEAPRPPAVDAWLDAERPMRFQTGYLALPLGRAFNAVVYFPGATRAAIVEAASTPSR